MNGGNNEHTKLQYNRIKYGDGLKITENENCIFTDGVL